MPLNTVNLISPVVTSLSSVRPENIQRWVYNGSDVAAITPTGMLDLRSSTTGTLPSNSTLGSLGTKIVFYSADAINPTWGFGLQSGRLVALIDSSNPGNSFSIRSSIGGSDIIRFQNDGNIGARFLDSINNNGAYIDMGPGGSGILVANRTPSHITISVRGAASQTANLEEWQNSAGAILARVSSAGGIFSTANSVLSGGLSVSGNYGGSNTMEIPNSQNIIGLTIRGFSTQTANLQEWRNSASVLLASINPSGFLSTPRINFTGGTSTVSALALSDGTLSFESTAGQLFSISNSLTGTIFSVNDISGLPIVEATDLGIVKINELFGQTVVGSGTPTSNTMLTSIARTATSVPIVAKGAASQTANLQEWHSSDGTARATLRSSGALNLGTLITGTQLSVIPFSNTTIGIVVRGAASQTANLMEWQNSSGTVLAKINADGGANFSGTNVDIRDGSGNFTIRNAGTTAYFTNSSLLVGTGYSAGIGVIIRGNGSQTADLQQWQDSAGTVLAKVDTYGYLTSYGAVLHSGNGSFESAYGGAFMGMKKTSSAVANPGADIARIYLVAGTTAGTLKLVVRAGASGAETTILDNIPQ